MIQIALIDKNSCLFENIGNHLFPLLYKNHSYLERRKIKKNINEYIEKSIEPYVQILSVPKDTFIETICSHLTSEHEGKNLNDFYYDTEWSYTFPKRYFEIMYSIPHFDYDGGVMNNLGCLFSLKHTVIKDKCAILAYKYDMSTSEKVKNTSICIKDIVKVIKRRYYSSAIVLTEYGNRKYYYQNKSYLVKKIYDYDDDDSICNVRCNLFNYNLILYTKNDYNEYINQTATRLNGIHRIYGDAIVFCEMAEGVDGNLSLNEFKKLDELSYGPLFLRESDGDCTDVKNISNEKPLWSKYMIVMSRKITERNTCCKCNSNSNQGILCYGCFRFVFCSNECMNDHIHDCIRA